MKKQRTDTNTERNLKIIQEYKEGNASFSDLAKKYNITPQRVQAIVKTISKILPEHALKVNAKKEEREIIAKQANLLYEKGSLEIAESIFKQVITWDLKNENIQGALDVHGHLSTIYSKMADQKKTLNEKVKFLKMAENEIRKALAYSKRYPKFVDDGYRAILTTHLVSRILKTYYHNKEGDLEKILTEGLEQINFAISKLAGSRAHLSWPKRLKGEILYNLGKQQEALDVLFEAEKDLFMGYAEELKGDPSKEFKPLIWQAKINITIATMALEMKRKIIADAYANAVIHTKDEGGYLNEMKREAKVILEKLYANN